MKVVQIPYCFHPDPIGGTEVYVGALARSLQDRGIQVIVAAPAERDASYIHAGLPVRRFALTPSVTDVHDVYGKGDALAAQAFGRIVDQEHPDLVHLHAFTSGASLRLVREVKRRGIPVIFTYHTPTVSCQRGTLMRWGSEVCDGVLDLSTCTSCTLHSLGLPRGAAGVIGRVPVAVGNMLEATHRTGGVWTALRMRSLIQARHATFRAMMDEVDHLVAVCQWVQDLLVRNGVPPARITLSRQGLSYDPANGHRSKVIPKTDDATQVTCNLQPATCNLSVAFLGRLDPIKGVHVLVRALCMAPDLPVTLDVYGVAQGDAGQVYRERLMALAGGDPRIRFCAPVPAEHVVSLLRSYDLLAVPSQCLETGPMVVLEAFAAGTPVIGSRLGGIAELVKHGVDGMLVKPEAPEEWHRTLQSLVEGPAQLTHLRDGVRPPRTMSTVVNEMITLYRTLLSEAQLEKEATVFA